MPPLETYDLHQDAIYWEKLGDNRFGEPRLDSPVDLKVRWINARADLMGPEGNNISVDATVITNQDVVIGSIMRQGTIDDYTGTGTALDVDEVYTVAAFAKIPSLNNKYYYRSVGLVKYGSRIPQ